MKKFNMIMLGPSKVGKSSLLASMYHEFAKLECDFSFLPSDDDETAGRLDVAYHELSGMTKGGKFEVPKGGLRGNQEFQEFTFEVKHNDNKQFDLIFHDFRGGVIKGDNRKDLDELKARIRKSNVIFNMVDCVPMMELDGFGTERHNSHTRIAELLDKTLLQGSNYLVIFVLVKGEKYLHQGQKNKLLAKFNECHKAVFNVIAKKNKGAGKVAAVTIPVETLGCVEFHQFSHNPATGADVFDFIKMGKTLSPKDIDQVLKYALAFALTQVAANKPIWTRVIEKFTGKNKQFQIALKKFYRAKNEDYDKFGKTELFQDNE